MLSHWLLFVSLFLLTTFAVSSPKIYGGMRTSNAKIGGFAVQIFYQDKLACTGTLLTSRHLITSAHCFENMAQADLKVVAGMTNEFENHNQSGTVKNGMVEVRLHPDFNKTEFIADIAVIKTQYPLKGPTIGYANLCRYPLYDGDGVNVVGWDTTGKSRSPGERNYLRTMHTNIVGHKKCQKKLKRKMPRNILCAGENDHLTICNGASSAPLIWQEMVCGIASWTGKCDDKKPDVYMSVRYYTKFIESTIEEMGYN